VVSFDVMDEPSADPFGWVGATIDGKYAVEEVVGEGGFGVVYRGHHLGFEEKVAVKCLRTPPTLVGEQRQRFFESFMSEGRLLHQLSRATAGIVQALDVGGAVSPNKTWTPYLVLEWLEGRSLEQDFSARQKSGLGGRSLAEAIELLEPAARALALVHEQGVAHRDIKPSNLFISRIAGRDTLKVLDFGIAKVITESEASRAFEATGRSLVAFTPRYGAPEQFSRRYGATGTWTDVYAFALVLIEAVAGRSALQGDDAAELFVATADAEHRPSLKAAGIEADPRIEEVIAKALVIELKDRFKTAGEFWEALVSVAVELGLIRREQLTLPDSRAFGQGGSVATRLPMESAATELPGILERRSSALDVTSSPSVIPATKPTPARLAVAIAIASAIFASAAALGIFMWRADDSESTARTGPETSASELPGTPLPPRVDGLPPPGGSEKITKTAARSTLSGVPARQVGAGRVPPHDIWMNAFDVLERAGTSGLPFLAAQAHCLDAGKYLCTETQWTKACTAHPVIGKQASWTLSAERGGIVVRGGKDCGSQTIAPGGTADLERVALCCDRAIGIDLKGYNTQTLTNLAKRLIDLENSLNRRDVESFVKLLDQKVVIEDKPYSNESSRNWFAESIGPDSDEWRVLDVCEVSVDTKTTYKRVRGRRRKVHQATWINECRETRHRTGQIAVFKTTYVLDESLKFAQIGLPKALREFATP
jgi:serine/threonine-protein kinase